MVSIRMPGGGLPAVIGPTSSIECRSAAARFDPAGLEAFRRRHPRGRSLVVTPRSTETHTKAFGDVEVEFVPYLDLPARLDALR